MQRTKIEWATHVWNPVTVSGCSKVSESCRHCYVEGYATRFWGERKFTDVYFHPERLEDPLKVKRPAVVFVNSMSDLFHPDVPSIFIDKVFLTMKTSHNHAGHVFILLTKRPERMHEYITRLPPDFAFLPNIWMGVSVENQETADARIPVLLVTPAAHRFVSVEPMLDGVKLQGWDGRLRRNYLDSEYLGNRTKHGPLDWVICGCESGWRRRPMDPAWVRSLRNQCVQVGVPFFLRQMEVEGKVKIMPELDTRVWDEAPKLIKDVHSGWRKE